MTRGQIEFVGILAVAALEGLVIADSPAPLWLKAVCTLPAGFFALLAGVGLADIFKPEDDGDPR